jgi:DNA-binding CsgD family transcriptional regulator
MPTAIPCGPRSVRVREVGVPEQRPARLDPDEAPPSPAALEAARGGDDVRLGLPDALRLLFERQAPEVEALLKLWQDAGGEGGEGRTGRRGRAGGMRPTRRQLQALYYVDSMGMTFAEAAERMGISRQSVHTLLARIRRALGPGRVPTRTLRLARPSAAPRVDDKQE